MRTTGLTFLGTPGAWSTSTTTASCGAVEVVTPPCPAVPRGAPPPTPGMA